MMYIAVFKPIFDFITALVALIILSPLLILISLILAFNHQGHPIFSQKRIGQHGKPFIIYKFKTLNQAGVSTPFLQVLRDYKVDELPQLFNILKFEMSWVGPRPDIPGYYDQLPEKYQPILKLKPGITGYASLTFANEEALLKQQTDPLRYNNEVIFPEKLRLNLAYLQEISFFIDLQIIFKTLLLLFK